MSHPTRAAVGFALLALTIALIALDLATTEPLDPFSAPTPIALGSGEPPTGAHCATAF